MVNKFCIEYELINHNWEEELSEAEKDLQCVKRKQTGKQKRSAID